MTRSRIGHTVCYTSAHQMLAQLRAARAGQSLERTMLCYTAPDLLMIDDLGIRPLEADEPLDLYEIIRQRHERGLIVATSNRAVPESYPLFIDELMASAAMDRLPHPANVLVMEGHLYRNPPPESGRPPAVVEPTTTQACAGRLHVNLMTRTGVALIV